LNRTKPHFVARYRRSSSIALYTGAKEIVCLDQQTGRRSDVPSEVAGVLCLLGRWVTVRQLATRHPDLGEESSIQEMLDAMVRHGLVERAAANSDQQPSTDWQPEAAIFHFGTRDSSYPDNPFAPLRQLRAKGRVHPPPPPTKTMKGRRIDLPTPEELNGLPHTLKERRTWRRFADRPLTQSQIATLLQLTWGVQRWATIPNGRIVFKTSPSGGARHPTEAYLIALDVKGLRRGVYHYAAADHQLVDLRRSVSRRLVTRLLANQHYFGEAGALVVMSAVFARTMWKYNHSRAYRAILTEAGHLGQTFCLVATALDLAPFTTMAFRDSELERLIGIDGITEAAMYVVGVGTRPRGAITYPGRVARKMRR